MDTLLKEIEKCVARCANCHRKKSYIDAERVAPENLSQSSELIIRHRRISAENLQILRDIKAESGCEQCGLKDPQNTHIFDFNHLECFRHLKRGDLGVMARQGVSVEVLLRERYKCEVLCANCHVIHTQHQRKVDTAKKYDPAHPDHASVGILETDFNCLADTLVAMNHSHLVRVSDAPKSVVAYNRQTGEFVGRYVSQKSASKILDVNSGSIVNNISGRTRHAGDYIFKRE